jgi:hypothetical protein
LSPKRESVSLRRSAAEPKRESGWRRLRAGRARATMPAIMRGELRADHQKTGCEKKFRPRRDFMLH